jgi:hypothetical protein
MAAKGTDKEITPTVEGVIQAASPVRRMLNAMAMEATMNTGETFSGDDILSILDAETEQEMFEADQQGPLNMQHLEDCELAIYDVTVKFGRGGNDDIKTMFIDPDSGKQMYLWVTAARISDAGNKSTVKLPGVGEQFQLSTSARYVVAKLWWLSTHGKIDRDAGLSYEVKVDGTDLGGGQTVIKLLPVPKRAERSVSA